MSLHKFAEQVAQHGRGDDSLLVHMTPDEVQRLQAFAEANGRSMTINPTTGLPEAGFLSDLFKAVAPIALGAFLGPAGAAFGGGLFASAATAGLAVGGITTLATGSLSRGLMAGLGAYGGAGLAEGFLGAGGNALVAGGAPIGAENLAGGVNAAGNAVSIPPIEQVNPSNFNLSGADKLGAGFKAAATDPLAFAQQNLGNLGYAAAPILAGAMVPTTTKAPTSSNENYIRQFDFNINPDTGRPDPMYGVRSMAPVKANEFGNKTFQGQRDLFRQQNPNPYELGVGSLNQPPQPQLQQTTPMATGGIVALAAGGSGTDAAGGQTVEDLYASIGRTPDAGGLAFWQSNFGKGPVTADQAASFMQSANAVKAQEAAAAPAAVVAPTTIATPMGASLDKAPPQPIVDTFPNNTGITALQPQATTLAPSVIPPPTQISTADAQAAVNNIYKNVLGRDADAVGLNFWSNAIANGRSVDSVYQDILKSANEIKQAGTLGDFGIKTLTAADAAKPYTGYTSTASDTVADEWVRNVLGREPTAAEKAQSWYKDSSNLGTTAEAAKVYKDFKDYAAAAGKKTDLSWMEASQLKALPTPPIITRPPTPPIITRPPVIVDPITGRTTTSTVLDTNSQTNAPVGTTNPYGNINNPGDLTFNADGSTTVTPNIPGRPYGGFSGIQEIKNAYTKGGGSLGYTSRVPKSIDEFNQLYNKQTDDSEAAYNYLMGKGAAKYPKKSVASQIAVPYADYALGKKNTGLRPPTVTGNVLTAGGVSYDLTDPTKAPPADSKGAWQWNPALKRWNQLATAATADTGVSGVYNDGAGTGPAGTTSDGSSALGGTATEKNGGLLQSKYAMGGYAVGGGLGSLGSYSDGGRLLKGPGDGVSDSIPATIGRKQQPARLADGEFVVPARIVSELGNGSTDAGAKKLYAMMDRVQRARGKTTGKNKVAANSRSDKYLPA